MHGKQMFLALDGSRGAFQLEDDRNLELLAMACDWLWRTDDRDRVIEIDAISADAIDLTGMKGQTFWAGDCGAPHGNRNLEMLRAALDARTSFRDLRITVAAAAPSHPKICIALSGAAEFDASGTYIGHRGVARNIDLSTRDVPPLSYDLDFENTELGNFLDAIPALVIVKAASGEIRFVNKCYADFLGIDAVQAVGRKSEDLLCDNSAGLVRKLEETVLPSRHPAASVRHYEKNGNQHFIMMAETPILNSTGGCAGIVASGFDVTALNIRDGEMFRNSAMIRSILDNVPAMIYAKDEEGRFILANDKFIDFYDLRGKQVLGSTSAELHDAQLVAMAESHDARVKQERRAIEQIERSELDGHTRIVKVIKAPMFDENGNVDGIVGVDLDITDLVEARQAASDSARKLESLMDELPAAVANVDARGRYTFLNRMALRWLGKDPDAILGGPFGAALSGSEASKIVRPLEAAQRGELTRIEERIRYPDGIERDVIGSYVPYKLHSGDSQSVAVFFVDNSAAVQLEAISRHVQHAQRLEMIRRLSGGMAHEFNNVFGILLGHLGMLERYVEPSEETAKRMDRLRSAIVRGVGLTQNLLDSTRLQKREPDDGNTDAGDVLQGITDLIEASIDKSHSLEISCPDGNWHVPVAVNDLENAIFNLVFSVEDAMSKIGRIRVAIEALHFRNDGELADGEYISLSVSSDGMDAEELRKALFLSGKAENGGQRPGLGLNTAYDFARRCGGTLRLIEGTDHGAAASIILPKDNPSL